MSLAEGTRLGPYEIAGQLGAGGMGEVYRATDTRLDRTVAIKVLPEHLADDPQRRERFEREAKAVSSLNHPHICTLHDVGEQDGVHYLVMELVEGDTLQQRLEKGRLPLDQALEYAIQIADALDKAHRQGVVHRDLKPGNIMITKSAGVKLLDFGLAKLKGDAAEVSPLSQMPTQDPSAPLTEEGTIIGTLQYMAPEQLEGKEADARTDIFAFGAVVYEMVTGKKAFEGKSQASLVGAIMNSEPQSMSALEALTPPAFDYVVRTALAKDPDDRWQAAHDLMGQIKWIVEGGTQLGIPAPVAVQRRKKQRLAWSLVALLSLSTLAFGILSLRPANVASTLRLAVTLPEELSVVTSGWPRRSLAISPDGKRVVYRGRNPDGVEGQLYSRFLDELAVEALPGTEDASQPFFSPDGNWVAFFTRSGELKKLRFDGGSPATIARGIPNSSWTFGSWHEDDTIVFASFGGPLQQVSAEGGAPPTSLSTLDATEGELGHMLPMFIRETGDVLFTVISSDGKPSIEVMKRDTLERFHIIDNAGAAIVAESGHLLFNRERALMAVPFDSAARRVTGPVQPLPESVARDNGGIFQLVASQSGTIAYVPARPDLPDPTLGWVDRTRAFTELGPVPLDSQLSGLSPDGRTALIEIRDLQRSEILSFDLLRGIPTPIYARESVMDRPRWHPDGQRITLGGRGISLLDADSGAESDLTEEGDEGIRLGSWSPDGGTLAYMSFSPQENIYALTPGEGEPQPVVATDAREHSPVISPDGEWIAYVSDESGRDEVWVARFPEGSGRRRISIVGGDEPLWSRDGRELFFRSATEAGPGPRSLMVVTILVADALEIGPPQVLFPVPNRPENERFRIGGNSGTRSLRGRRTGIGRIEIEDRTCHEPTDHIFRNRTCCCRRR